MTTIKEIYDYSEMSFAAYASTLSDGMSSGALRVALQTNIPGVKFTEEQAKLFSSRFEIVSHQPNTDSGFSATLLKDISKEPNEYILAIRGTENPFILNKDWRDADFGDIGGDGIAASQAVDLYNYYQKLTAKAGETIYEYKYIDEIHVVTTYGVVTIPARIELTESIAESDGPLSGGEDFTVTGHSLGGHLAIVMQRLAPNRVDGVYTFNAPGFDPLKTTPGSTGFLSLLRDAEISATGSSHITLIQNIGIINNYVVEEDLVSDLGYVPGSREYHFSENTGSFGSHSIYQVVDSFAVASLLESIDKDISLLSVTNILKSASNTGNNSLETIVNAINEIFVNDGEIVGVGDSNRNDLYIAIYKIKKLLPSNTEDFSIIELSSPSYNSDLVQNAINDIASRYALINLNPFVVVGDNSIYTKHNSNGELNLYDPDSQKGSITREYLKDRALLLNKIIDINVNDKQVFTSSGLEYYKDYSSNIVFSSGSLIGIDNKFGSQKQYIFGDSNDNTFSGGAKDDRLYGGGGIDTIHGQGGDDYIEGNQGNDILNGDDGEDLIRGGYGDDTISGGLKDDVLYGNKGIDTIHGNEDNDEIYGGNEGDFLYGDSGIDKINGEKGSDYIYGGNQRDYLDGGEDDDFLYGEDGKDSLVGGSGNDQLYGGDGTDSLFGGDDEDILWGGDESDYLNGGAGLDILYGGKGNDTLVGNLEEDILEGGEGHDTYIISGNLPGGHATINDSGDNTIIFNGQAIDLAQGKDGTWNSLDGRFTITKNSPLTITDNNTGTSITVNDADLADLGIQLVDTTGQGATGQVGTGDDDVLQGTGASDKIIGGGGSDMLNGRGGNDYLYADNEIDIATFLANDNGGVSASHDWINAGSGDDIAVGNDGTNVLLGGDGKDILLGGGNTDYLFGDGDAYPLELDSTGHTTGKADTEWEVINTPDGITLSYLNADGTLHPRYGDNDIIYAGSGDDYAWGGLGNDSLYGGTGNDQLVGGEGHDALMGEDGDDHIFGDDDDPRYLDQHGNDYINAGSGNDEVAGQGGNDIIDGEDGDDLLIGDDINIDTAYHGNDVIHGGSGNDRIFGDAGDDQLYGGADDDIINGDDASLDGATHGDDVLYGEQGNDTLVGGGGRDRLYGGTEDDILAGDADDLDAEYHADDELYGGDGNDTLIGGGGKDILSGDADNDTLVGDSFYLDGQYHDDDRLDGGEGNDVAFGGGGNDTIYGGAGNDELQGDASGSDLDGQYHGNDTLYGGEGDDRLFGQGGQDTLAGGSGDDVLVGDAAVSSLAAEFHGNDILDGGEGNDILFGAGGNDALYGGAGNDVMVGDSSDLALDQHGDDRLYGGDGDDLMIAGGGNDYLSGGTGVDQIYGEQGNDTLYGGDGNDIVSGNDGDDIVSGDAGNDTIFGGAGNDTLRGGTGNDTLIAGTGSDVLAGGEGTDLYVYNLGDGVDVIQDSGFNTLSFGIGIGVSDISLALGSLEINVGNSGDAIHIEGFNPDDPYANVAINRFEFADGTVLSYQQLLNLGFDLNGTDGDDTIYGTALDDRISGFAGNDTIIAKDGNDTLDGGDGADTLYGDGGNDQLTGGSGADTMYGGQGDDTYLAVEAGDTIVEYADEGTDGVQADFSYTLGDNLENLSLTGSANLDGTGNALANTISGNSGDNSLSGLDGNDRLLGGDGNDSLNGGSGEDHLNGGVGDDSLDGGSGIDRLGGGAGNDTYYVDDYSDYIFGEGSGEGTDSVFSTSNYSLPQYIETSYYINYGTPDQQLVTDVSGEVENLTLVGPDAVVGYGNDLANTVTGTQWDNELYGMGGDDVLVGGDGNDRLNGGDGRDTMIGGNGDDRYYINQYAETVTEDLNAGHDIVYSGVNYSLTANVEELVLTGYSAKTGYGNQLDNVIVGNTNNNILDGKTGADTLAGGLGSDIYYVDNTADVVIEEAGAGVSDTVNSYVDYTLSDNVENLTLQLGAISGTGNDLNNYILGNASSNTLYGMGGSDFIAANWGDDIIDGGSGNDNLRGDDGNDTLYGGDGDDYVFGGNGDDIQYGGSGNDYVHGGLGVNTLYGGDGNDTLAAGNTMYGGKGNDEYYVYNTSDQVTEQAGEGHDHVYSWVNYTLADNVEDLSLRTYNISGTGNALDNTITGFYGNETLSGLAGNDVLDGGWGADTMIGGSGDDQYIVDNSSDVIIENAGEGIDSVLASQSYILSQHVENLTLSDSGSIDGTGNDSDNILIGNDGDNTLSGLGGNDDIDAAAGDDVLYGGTGDDYLYGGDDAVMYNDYGDEGGETCGECDPYGGYGGYGGDGGSSANLISNSDYLDGGEGNDHLDGGSGNDSLYGGDGSDYLYGGDDGGAYIDGNMVVLPNNDYLNGGAGDDTLEGGSGDDVLDGGTGIDVMAGGSGNDIYYVDGYTEVTTPPDGDTGGSDPGQGTGGEEPCDRCEDDFNLFEQIELERHHNKGNEGLGNGEDPPPPGHDENWNDGEGSYPGNPGNKYGANANSKQDGHSKNAEHASHDVDSGSAADSSADSQNCDASTGGDTGTGGGGTTTPPEPVITYVTDVVIEGANSGYDVVNATISYTLTANVEELRLIGPEALASSGNSLDNLIIGNEYDNLLDGGAGADTLVGGLGNDTYVVDNPYDIVQEYADQGIDTVQASIDYQLSSHVENLQLVGLDNLQGQGNELDNQLTGNDGDNSLYGADGNDILSGGAGNDLLAGGAGDDTYIYAAGSGVDRIEDSDGINSLQFAEGINSDQVIARTMLVDGNTVVQLRLLDQYGNELGDQGIDFVQAADGSIPVDSFNFADGTQASLADMLITQETYNGSCKSDQIITDRNDDTIFAGRGNDLVNSAGGNDVIYGEWGRDTLFAAAGDDQLYGGDGDDTLYGSFGQDVLHGGDDEDRLYGGTGNDLLFGADDEDKLHGGSGNDLLIGGRGNDELVIGCGADIIAYNQGDGLDEVEFGADVESTTISLGGGINLSDIYLQQHDDDLVIGIKQDRDRHGKKGCRRDDRQGIVLDDWYDTDDGTTQQPYLTLQVVMSASEDFDASSTDPLYNQEIQTFDLSAIIAQYDLAQAAESHESQWDVMEALLDNYLEGSDTDALGGSLAYQYGLGNNVFDDSGLVVSASQLASKQFGKEKQAIAS